MTMRTTAGGGARFAAAALREVEVLPKERQLGVGFDSV